MLKREISLKNNLRELERLTSFLEETASAWGFSNDFLFRLNMVLEEVVSNIVLYGFEGNQTDEEILVEMTFNQEEVNIWIKDHGVEFDPLKVPPPDDLEKVASERNIGGLGVYFVRQLMDKVEYQRKGNSNILVLTKKII